MDNKNPLTAKFTHHDLKFHKVWWKSYKRCGSWSGQTGRFLCTPQTMFAGGIITSKYAMFQGKAVKKGK
jgi:hypothetical protein